MSWPDPLFPAALVCPRCRVRGPDGKLIVSRLQPAGPSSDGSFSDRCGRCGLHYPRTIEGIRCVLPDPDALAGVHRLAADLICDDELDARQACERLCRMEPGNVEWAEAVFVGQHALAHFPSASGRELACNTGTLRCLLEWLGRHQIPAGTGCGCALDVGCGPGALLQVLAPLFPNGALGLDARVGVLRLARKLADCGAAIVPFCVEGSHFAPLQLVAPSRPSSSICLVLGDALAPPLEAEAFPIVTAMSLLDSVADPIFAVGQLDALLAPGGLFLAGTPYSWDARVTPPREWWSGPRSTGAQTLRAALSGRHPVLPHLTYDILEQADLRWAIPGHSRLIFQFVLDVVLARKRAR